MKRNYVLAGVMAFSLAFLPGFITDGSDNYFEISKNLDIFGKLYREINTNYVDDPDPNDLMQTGIDAMLSTLDPYTNYISEEEVADYEFLTTGSYAGIGALIGKRENQLMIMEPYESYPASEAGLRAGDVLQEVAGTRIDGKTMEVSDVRNLLRGETGTEVKVVVLRGTEKLTFMVKRSNIRVSNVPYYGMVNEHVGYIALTGFTQDAGLEVEQAYRELSRIHQLRGIILDLRDNPGGRLDEAVNVTNVFAEKDQLIVETRGRITTSKRKHIAPKPAVDPDIPLVVLVNGGSASASEIVAGAIQDLDRGLIIGRRSFGKGLVQNIRPLSYNTQLKVTTAKYYTPSGRCIQAINYAERNPDGSVARIADSLKNAFQTANGRTVYDGGGIEPDVPVAAPQSLTLLAELDRQGIVFDFATNYAAEHPQLAAPGTFQVTDQLYAAFIAFAKERKFTYLTEAERKLQQLESSVQKESYAAELATTINGIRKELASRKDLDLAAYRDLIEPMIREEIVRRYYFERGAIETSLQGDPDVEAAVSQLMDEATYRQLLSPR